MGTGTLQKPLGAGWAWAVRPSRMRLVSGFGVWARFFGNHPWGWLPYHTMLAVPAGNCCCGRRGIWAGGGPSPVAVPRRNLVHAKSGVVGAVPTILWMGGKDADDLAMEFRSPEARQHRHRGEFE